MSSHDIHDLQLEQSSTPLPTNPPSLPPRPEGSPGRPGTGPSLLAKRLAVLLRCHEAARWHNVWLWIWWGIRALVVIGVAIPLCIGIGNAVCTLYLQEVTANYSQAQIAGWTAGLGSAAAILLLWAIFEGLWPKRFRPLEEQLAAIQRDHAAELRSWGSPSVLREPAAVAEILQHESHT